MSSLRIEGCQLLVCVIQARITVAASFRISSQGKSLTVMKQAMGDLSNWYYGVTDGSAMLHVDNKERLFDSVHTNGDS